MDAFRYFNGRASPGSNRDWRLDYIPADPRKVLRASNTGEFGAENRIVTFRKERLRKDPPAECVAPGHPLFDLIRLAGRFSRRVRAFASANTRSPKVPSGAPAGYEVYS